MSLEATTWAWKQKLSPTHKLVLMAICDCHNASSGKCNPSFEFIAEKACVSRITAIRAVRELADEGYVSLLNSRNSAGKQLTNTYILHIGKPEYQNETLDDSRVSFEHEPSITDDTRNEPEEKNRKSISSVSSETRQDKSKPNLVETQFEAFWGLYPKRKGGSDKKRAKAAYVAALRRADHDAITAGAKQYLAYCTSEKKVFTEFVKMPATWLNGDCWSEPYTPAAAPDVDWSKALNTGRRVKVWKPEYGPPPGADGCMVPSHMLQPGDGAGWQSGQGAKAA